MDNITHSLTGALTAKMLDRRPPAERDAAARVIFWLLVLSANLPDIDILFGLLGNPVYALQMHRGITHSMLFAPLFALLPALVFWKFGPVKNFPLLWTASLAGILLHIFIDLITPFGTQLAAPVSTERFALDWMFIVDPVFTAVIALLMYLSRRWVRLHRALLWGCTVFVLAYIALAGVCHAVAIRSVSRAAFRTGSTAVQIGALPQPLNVFHWMGIVQTDRGVSTAYFSVFDPPLNDLTVYANANDSFTRAALATPEGSWYSRFARFPWINSFTNGAEHIVEIHDMQFSFDRQLARTFGLADRPSPFTMRFRFTSAGALIGMTFNR